MDSVNLELTSSIIGKALSLFFLELYTKERKLK